MANNFKNKPLKRELTRPLNEAVELFKTSVDAEDIAECLEVPYGQMKHILYAQSEEKKYTTFEIPKKSGGVRLINSPSKSIAILQQKLKLILEEIVPTNLSAHGFVKGRSIVTNAKNHTKKRYVLNFDLENFFPSINFGRVRGIFMASPFKLGIKAATVVAQIVCCQKKLPQGACTSPIIANHIAKRLDGSMRNICRRAKCSYTRYADDITVSTSHKKFPRLIAHYSEDSPMHEEVVLSDQVLKIVEDSGFGVNDSKTRLQIGSCGQQVTGLLVNEFVNVPRSFIDKTRAMIYSWREYGIKSAAEYSKGLLKYSNSLDDKSLEAYYRNSVIGRLSYIKMVRGEGDIVFAKLANELAGLLDEGPEFIMNYKNMKKS